MDPTDERAFAELARSLDVDPLRLGAQAIKDALRVETDQVAARGVFGVPTLSVWESPEQLRDFTYRRVHVEVMRQRKSWFERFDGMYYALWWVAAGHIPSIEEANGTRHRRLKFGLLTQGFPALHLQIFLPPDFVQLAGILFHGRVPVVEAFLEPR